MKDMMIHDNNSNNDMMTMTMASSTPSSSTPSSSTVQRININNPLLLSLWNYHQSMMKLLVTSTSLSSSSSNNNEIMMMNNYNTSCLSLRQVVPMYQCWLDNNNNMSYNNNNDNIKNDDNDNTTVSNNQHNTNTNNNDIEFCRSILLSSSSSSSLYYDKLVIVQYLLFVRYHNQQNTSTNIIITTKTFSAISNNFDDIISFILLSHYNNTNNNNNTIATTIINHDDDSSCCSCWDLLSYVVLPILLFVHQHNNIDDEQQQQQQQDTSSSSSSSSIMNHPEFIDSILDATFQYYHTTKELNHNHLSSSSSESFELFQQCLHTCLYPQQKQQQQQLHHAAHINDNNNHDDNNQNNNNHHWNISCQILYRIYQFIVTNLLQSTSTTTSNHGQYYHTIMECIQTKIKIGIQLAFRNNNSNNDNNNENNNINQLLRSILKPIIDYLIPCIIDTSVSISLQHPPNNTTIQQQQYVRNLYDDVWKTIIDTYDPQQQQQNQQQQLNNLSSNTLLVSTTILCSILPSLLTIEQQQREQKIMAKDESATTILHHRVLWDMIYMCLRQGIIIGVDDNIETKQHDTSWMNHNDNSQVMSSSSDNAATCQLCRRRGIYLLHVLIQSSLLSSSSSSSEQLLLIQQLQLWNQYVSCYETLEMESEQHLIDQVWDTVTLLFHHNNNQHDQEDDINSSHNIPNITWKWLSLLLAKSLTAIDAPVLRKFTLFRLLQGRAGIYYDNDNDESDSDKINDQDINEQKQANDTVPNENNNQISKKELKKNQQQQRKQQKEIQNPTTTMIIRGAPISIIPPEFFVNIIITSFDSLVSSVGWNMHIFSNDIKNVPSPQQQPSGNNNNNNNNNKKKVLLSIDLGILFSNFCQSYLLSMKNDNDKIQIFFHHLWNHHIVCQLHRKTIVHIFQAIASAIQTYNILIPITDYMLQTITLSYQSLFSLGSLVHKYKTIMLRTLATMLEYSTMSLSTSLSSTKPKTVQYSPMSVLQILALYPIPNRNSSISNMEQQSNEIESSTNKKLKEDDDSWINQEPYWISLRHWLVNVVCTPNMNHTKQSYMSMLGAAVATSYVDGILISSTPLSSLSDHDRAKIKSDDTTTTMLKQNLLPSSSWDPKKGPSNLERSISGAIGLLCALPCVVPTTATAMGNNNTKTAQNNNVIPTTTTTNSSTSMAASEMLWPAIYRGLRYVNSSTINNNTSPTNPNNTIVRNDLTKADSITRALLLLEVGCRLRIISGLGNGDLIISSKTGEMMPPPPHIEGIISNAVHFILQHIELLMDDGGAGTEDVVGGGSRSNDARQLSATFTKLVSQLQVLAESYPSSPTITSAIDTMLKDNMTRFYSGLDDNKRNSVHDDRNMNNNVVQHLCLVYATLSCGGKIESSQMLPSCRIILKLEFDNKSKVSGGGGNSDNQQASRSIFQYAKWGALSCILPQILNDDSTSTSNEVQTFLIELLDIASVSVEATPSEALVPLFNCVITASSECFLRKDDANTTTTTSQLSFLEKVINSMFRLLADCRDSNDIMYVIDEICSLLFHPKMLLDEYHRIQQHGDNKKCPTPIRAAFRRFIEMAGTQKSYITRIVLSRICAGWIGLCNDSELCSNTIGLTAIPYRTDIMNLLLQKEDVVDESATNQAVYDCTTKNTNYITIPSNTNETSVTRGFILIFLSKLPQVGDKLEADVLNELLIPLIFDILKKIQATGAAIMYGTPEYCVKMRGWQALCILSRFVTASIAEEICKKIFYALEKEMIHCQIRYFIEIFTLQFARMHPETFFDTFVREIPRRDLSLQMISSLMIISGNLIVGRYQHDFFLKLNNERDSGIDLNVILASVIPWLSSTQGFSRAIAQLLTHKLIPLVVDVSNQTFDTKSNDWYLRSVYRFLEENPEMKRLRKKQTTFFEQYEVDAMCTPEGVLSIPVDEGNESNPIHLIDLIKECLQNVYDEGNVDNAPTWRQMEYFADAATNNEVHNHTNENIDGVNFQRKIIPVDALNLALDDIRKKKEENMVGRKKQNLIVCASLIDKIPNLGGLTRTAEIFAADRLVIPDIRITKMDNFKGLTVGAHDWIDIEECKEENLLQWLRQKKTEGFMIIGVEQTSSSQSLLDYQFPKQPIVLLLGKEKEGIPVQLLQVVDQCIEIPQLGIIRSLNVHVSGAICIWEHRKQQMKGLK